MQWHPEADPHDPLTAAFIASATEHLHIGTETSQLNLATRLQHDLSPRAPRQHRTPLETKEQQPDTPQMSTEQNQALVRRFYEQLWNAWRLDLAGEILSPSLHFRGSLGTRTRGLLEFTAYVERVRSAFPDWHNHIEELLAADERVVARLTWTGTHTGPLGDIPPTGRHVSYVGAAFFRMGGRTIDEAWIVGDTQELWRALGLLAA